MGRQGPAVGVGLRQQRIQQTRDGSFSRSTLKRIRHPICGRTGIMVILVVSLSSSLIASCADLPHVPLVSENYHIPADFRIVGYFPSWSGNPETIEYRALTHVCYAFAAPTEEGDSFPIDKEEKLYRMMILAHHYGTKVMLSFGSWEDGSIKAYETIASSPALTMRFTNTLLDLISRYDLDGIDIDMEFPDESSEQDFADLVHSISNALHNIGKILSVAVSGDEVHGQYYLDSIIDDADFLNIMAYDDGLDKPAGANHSTYAFAGRCLDYWTGVRHVPRGKAVLGVPFYGRSLTDKHSISYYRLRKEHYDAAGRDEVGGFGYNGFDTIRAKAVNLARYRAGGIMIWQLNQDANGTNSLLNAIFDAVKEPD